MNPDLQRNLDHAIDSVSNQFNLLRDDLWAGSLLEARKRVIKLQIALAAAAWYTEKGQSHHKSSSAYFKQHLPTHLT